MRRFLGLRGLPGQSRELGGCGRLWHGCSLPLARDSFARGGGGGLPGSRDEEARPGRPGSSLVTRACVACKHSLEDNGKGGKGEVSGTRLPAGLQIPVPLVGRRRRGNGRWGDTPGSPESGWAPAAIPEEFRFPRDREHFPALSQADPLPSPICLVIGPESQDAWDWATLEEAGEGASRGEGPTLHRNADGWDPGPRAPAPPCSDLGVRISKSPLCSDPGDRASSPSYVRTPKSGRPAPFSLSNPSPSPQPLPPSHLGVWLPSPFPPRPGPRRPAREEVQGRTPPRSPRSQRENPWPERRPGIPSGMTVGKGMAGVPRGGAGG